jgi:hypothetical protein
VELQHGNQTSNGSGYHDWRALHDDQPSLSIKIV